MVAININDISINDIKELLDNISKDNKEVNAYPMYIGEGLWKIAPNCITGERGVGKFMRVMHDNIENKSIKG